MVTKLKGKRLYVNVFGKEFNGIEYDKINGIGLSYHIVAYMRYHLLYGKYPWEIGIPDFDGDRLDVLNKADRKNELESFKTNIAAEMGSKLENLCKDVLKSKDGSIVTTPVQNVYKVTCSVGFDIDLILIRATSEMEAWDKFWEHFKDEPNLNHEGFGSKDEYEYGRGYWKRKGSIVSITIEPINTTSDFLYIGGGRSV